CHRNFEQAAPVENEVMRVEFPICDAVMSRSHWKDRRVELEADFCKHLERPKVVRSTRKILRAKRCYLLSRCVFYCLLGTSQLLAQLRAAHPPQRSMAVSMRLHLVPLIYQGPDEARERVRHSSLHGSAGLDASFVEQPQQGL